MRAGFLAVSALVVAGSVQMAGQTSTGKAAAPKSTKPFSPPKTAWGDPDISGSEEMQPYECHEGNYGLINMLEIARAADRKIAGAQGGR